MGWEGWRNSIPADGTGEVGSPPPHVCHEGPEREDEDSGLSRRSEVDEGDDEGVLPAPGGSDPAEVFSPFPRSIKNTELVHVGAQLFHRNTCSLGHGNTEFLEVSGGGKVRRSRMTSQSRMYVGVRNSWVMGKGRLWGRERGRGRLQLISGSLEALGERGLGRIVPGTALSRWLATGKQQENVRKIRKREDQQRKMTEGVRVYLSKSISW